MTLTLETQDLQRLAQEWAEGSIHKGEPTVEMVNKRNGMVAIVTFVEPDGERTSPLDEHHSDTCVNEDRPCLD